MRGGEALRRQLDVHASRSRGLKGWEAQLKYLTESQRGRERAVQVYGLGKDPANARRNIIAWLSGEKEPNAGNRAAIQRAYDERRRPVVAKALLKALNNDGEGTIVEVHPLDNDVHTAHLGIERIEITEWEDIIQAWYDNDQAELDEIWDDYADDIYPPGAYSHVSHLGF